MLTIRRNPFVPAAFAAASLLLASAAGATVQSSCAAPCTTPPRTSISVRETGGFTNQAGFTADLTGMLQKAAPKTIVRVDFTYMTEADASVTGIFGVANLNYLTAGTDFDFYGAPCDASKAKYCTISGTYWWDIDRLEALHPGQFVGQPLTIKVYGGSFNQTAGKHYTLTFTATIAKKK
jgi:hypothetical protein